MIVRPGIFASCASRFARRSSEMPSINPSLRSTLPSVMSRIWLFGSWPPLDVTITWIVLFGCLSA
ncbi:MAG: hypothetical protein AUG88_02450 [Actinobacteria bacterium 13_1_20CM_4_68_12]|nr:MAG: hypothetical protein AUG88_02450 [Actinobacteria bacterium 13_1_20CM_4_68_12]